MAQKKPTKEQIEAGNKAMALYYATAKEPTHDGAIAAVYMAMREIEK